MGNALAQQAPTGTPLGPISPTTATSTNAWLRGGNTNTGAGVNNNVFGTQFNSPIYTITNNQQRTRVNGTYTAAGPTAQPPINGVTFPAVNTSGYFGIGPTGYFGATTNSPVSTLHIQGPDNSGFGSLAGWRKWMKTGTFTSENSDAMYVGMKDEGPGTNRSDAIINWSDDSGSGGVGADKLRFIFTNPAVNPTSLNPLSPLSLPGYEYMRMVSSPTQTNSTGSRAGNVGIGPVFTDLLPPTNRLHINAEEQLSVFMQISNQNTAGGTGQTVNDGLHVGYAPTSIINKEAVVNQKENDRLTLYANNGERIRIMQIGALNNSILFNPGSLPTNLTRVSISEDPTQPVTRPLSLLHIGYNTFGATDDGWRSWMDVGMFASKFSDNVFLGLKAEPGILGVPGLDRHDAVLNWGDNQTSTFPTNGPDNLRFIFTSNIGGGAPPANGANGLETGRFYPGRDTLGTYGRFGVGDFTATGVNQNPTHKIDVVGNGRFRFLPDSIYRKDSLVKKIVFVDSLGVLRWEYADSISTGFGSVCGDSTSMLTTNRQIPMNNFNLYFTGQGIPTTDAIGLGYACGVPMPAKFNVLQQNPGLVTVSTIAGSFINRDQTMLSSLLYIGVNGISDRPKLGNTSNIGGDFMAGNAATSIGVRGVIRNSVSTPQCFGGFFSSQSALGVVNYGVKGIATSASTGLNYGVYGETDTTGTGDFAGYFVGNVLATGTITPSDVNFKENIDTISNADSVLNLLKPIYFDYKQTGDAERLNFSTTRQMGLLAQEVETVIPNIVTEAIHPAKYDTAGVEIAPSFTYKAVDYQKIIPLLIAGHKSQQAKIDSLKDENNMQDSINTYLEYKDSILDYRLTVLESALNACCNSHSMQQNNSNNSIAQQDVNLKDGQTVILQQNLPNPFAEQTTINYFLPNEVVKAQMLFYNAQGKLIQSVDLNDRGECSLNVFAQDLSNGIYTYTIVVDGKIFETKKMVKQQ